MYYRSPDLNFVQHAWYVSWSIACPIYTYYIHSVIPLYTLTRYDATGSISVATGGGGDDYFFNMRIRVGCCS